MLVDTDVLVWYLRGYEKAARWLETLEERDVSVVTYMELLQGARDRGEVRSIQRSLRALGFEMRPLTERIGHRASVYVEEYNLKTSMSLGDALIAATAVENGLVLGTANRKHYRSVQELEIKVFRP